MNGRIGRRRQGFTLIELLVAVAVIGILVALILPAVQQAREAARRALCRNNLKQIGLALHNYLDSFRYFPVSITCNPGEPTAAPPTGKGWITGILPHLDEEPLYRRLTPGFDGDMTADEGMRRADVLPWMAVNVAVLQCPSDPGGGVRDDLVWWVDWPADVPLLATNYKGVIGYPNLIGSAHGGTPDCHNRTGCQGVFFRNSGADPSGMRDLRDGASNTFLVGEVLPDYDAHTIAFYSNGDWASCHAPLNYFQEPTHSRSEWANVMSFRSIHPGGAQFLMGDGRVTFVSETVDTDVYRALSTKDGGEVASLE